MSGRVRAAAAAVLLAAIVTGCASDAAPRDVGATSLPASVQLLVDAPDAPRSDVVEVVVCDVPPNTADPLYGDRPLRLPLEPGRIAAQMDDGVRPYFTAISHGMYTPAFVPGPTLAMATTETHDQCVERAVDASGTASTVVMVVATAEDLDSASGGWGRPGTPCRSGTCPARRTRRALYVGASDFYGDGPGHVTAAPLLDLVEHELGHTLGLPHSGDVGDPYASALDVMSDSAAPRATDPSRIHAQDTIGINRLALGWLPMADVVVAPREGGTYALAPSTGAHGLRLVVLPVDETSFLTVEWLDAADDDDFLPESGVAVHLVSQAPAVCGHAPGVPCTGIDRRQLARNSGAGHTDLLDRLREALRTDGWVVTLTSAPTAAAPAMVQVAPYPTHG